MRNRGTFGRLPVDGVLAKTAEDRSTERHRVVVDLRIAVGAENGAPFFAPLAFVAVRVEVGLRVFGDRFADAPSLSGAKLDRSVFAHVQEPGACSTSPARASSGKQALAVVLFDEREGPTVLEMPPPGAFELRSRYPSLPVLVV